MPREQNKTVGIALGSGGARGLAHIGVLRELEHLGIQVNMIAGTSAGAVIGAMYAATGDLNWIVKRIQEFVRSDDFQEIGLSRFTSRWEPNPSFLQTARKVVKRHVLFSIANERLGLIRVEQLRNVIEYLLPVRRFDELTTPFSCSALDLQSGNDIVFSSGDLVEALTATSAVTGYIQPVAIGDNLLTDGGVSRPIPLQLLETMSPDVTIVVDVSLIRFAPLPDPDIMQILGRAEQITSTRLGQMADGRADVVIMPDISNVNWSDFTQIDMIIEAGRKAACNQREELLSKITTNDRIHQRIANWFRNVQHRKILYHEK